jgi:hypothetical protein
MIRTPYHLQESLPRWSGTIEMECNNECTVQVKGIIKMKLNNFDFVRAKKYVLITQILFSKLENINQMLAIINVHIWKRFKLETMKWVGMGSSLLFLF